MKLLGEFSKRASNNIFFLKHKDLKKMQNEVPITLLDHFLSSFYSISLKNKVIWEDVPLCIVHLRIMDLDGW